MKSNKAPWFACTILSIALLSSCISVSKFTSESVQLGMSKKSVVERFGQPYKTEIFKDGDDLKEIYYYKESVYSKDATGQVKITNIMNFTNDKLESLQQGEEVDPDAVNTKTIIKEEKK